MPRSTETSGKRSRLVPRILFIDEDPEGIDSLVGQLQEEGAVVAVRKPERGMWDTIEAFSPDLVVIDTGSSYARCEKLVGGIKQQWPDLDVVVLTGRASIHSAMAAINAGARRYLLKPVTPRTVLDIALEAVEKAELRNRLQEHVKQLEVHYEMAEALTAAVDPKEVATAAVQSLINIPGIEAAAVVLTPVSGTKPVVIASDSMSERVIEAVLEAGLHQDGLGEVSPAGTSRIIALPGREEQAGHLIVVPLSEKVWDRQKDLILSLAKEIGVALERALFYQRLSKAYQELKVAQRSLVEAEKQSAVGRLAAGLVHEIGTPLNIIAARAELLLEIVKEEAALKGLRVIIDQVERISRLMQQLLDFARQYPKEVGLVDISEVLTNVKSLVEGSSRGGVAEIQLFVPPEAPKVVGNKNQLEQVFVNLLINALDAIEEARTKGILREEGRVRLYVEELPRIHKLVVRVEDNGIGIPEENKSKVFEPFFTTKEPGKGTGLGLSVVYGLVTEVGGTVEIDSTYEKGTVVTVKLPTEVV